MKLLNVHQTRGACESCGHDIAWAYVVELDTGATTVLGSDCAGSLLGPGAVDRMKKITARATSQWRTKKPAAHEGEDRAAYIARRVAEMLNARAAWQAWQSLATSVGMGRHQVLTAINRLRERGIMDPFTDPACPQYQHARAAAYGAQWCEPNHCTKCYAVKAARDTFERAKLDELEAMKAEIEQRYHANRWDFTGPSYTLP